MNAFVKISGLTKQDYITQRLLNDTVIVQGNPRVYKALRNYMTEILQELKRIEVSSDLDSELLRTIQFVAKVMDGMKEEPAYGT